MKYAYHTCGVAPLLYPTVSHFGIFNKSQQFVIDIPQMFPYKGDWGSITSTNLLFEEEHVMPDELKIAWLSIVEKRFYYYGLQFDDNKLVALWLQTDNLNRVIPYSHIVVGMAPFGQVAIWISCSEKSRICSWDRGVQIEIPMSKFCPTIPDQALDDYCGFFLQNDDEVRDSMEKHGLPSPNLFDNYMKQFTYRYQVIFEHWDEDDEKWMKYNDEKDEMIPEFEYIEESLFDGTHDKLHDGGLMKYHEAGKPKKLVLKWHVKKSEYTANFWFEDERIHEVFDKLYGAHHETRTDFIIRIDAENRKYELALYRYGLKEPQVISEDVYQLLVFKNTFEDFRSDNYNQKSGAWIW